MGDGTRENPYTREDMLKKIEENGDTAEGLDLSDKFFEEGIDLRKFNLRGIILRKAVLEHARLGEAHLQHAHLEGAYLFDARLEGAHLEHAHLEGAYLAHARFEGAHLEFAQLEGAHLSNAHLEGAHLEFAHLEGAHLEHARLEGAHLEQARLERAHLEHARLEGAHLSNAHLEGAHLEYAHLEGAHLEWAHLEGVHLWYAKFSTDTRLEQVDWGNYILGKEKDGRFRSAVATYRQLKVWYKNAGISDIEGEFLYREMKCKTKQFWWGDYKRFSLKDLIRPFKPKKLPKAIFPRKPFHWAFLMMYDLLCGYGERPFRVIRWAASVVLGLALIYFLIGSVWEWWAFWNSLYFSAVSFTALGYGSWLQATNDWIRGIGAFESFVGVFTIALFLITFVRKMTR